MADNRVAVLSEDLRAQFRTFGEGLQMVNEKIDRVEQKLDAHIEQNRREFEENRRDHQQIMQMVKELDHEVQFEIKRVK